MTHLIPDLHTYRCRGPYYPPNAIKAFAWCPPGYHVAVAYNGQMGGVLVETETEWATATNADKPRAATYYLTAGNVPAPEETDHE